MKKSGRTLRSKARAAAEHIRTQYEYRSAMRGSHDDVASALPDGDTGVHIRGPLASYPEEADELRNGDSARPRFGRRRTDMRADHIITKKLVVVTVILVDALYLAGDALLSGQDICP